MLEKGLVKKADKDAAAARKFLAIAGRDLKAAEDNLEYENYDWSLAMAYNAMLQCGRALMHSLGHVPSGSQSHVAIVRFVQNHFRGEKDKGIFLLFDKIRKKRHQAVYDEAGIVTLSMASQAIKTAEEFMEKIKKEI
ncbi:MAG: HEPN domain-containing protein [Candidatus Diapherotrites archaeon]